MTLTLPSGRARSIPCPAVIVRSCVCGTSACIAALPPRKRGPSRAYLLLHARNSTSTDAHGCLRRSSCNYEEWTTTIKRVNPRVRATPLVRVKVKFTVRLPVCCRRRLSHTAILTVNLTLTSTSGVVLTGQNSRVPITVLLSDSKT